VEDIEDSKKFWELSGLFWVCSG